jgi:uncharacterized protein
MNAHASIFPKQALVRVEWPRVLFLHYRITPENLRAHVPRDFEIEVHDDSAWLTLVALTMRNFRPCRAWSPPGWLLGLRGEQRFLNARTYVRHGHERGALFLWGWLSRPLNLPLPNRPLGLPCGFADIAYEHRHEEGTLNGTICAGARRFSYSAALPAGMQFAWPKPGSLAEFALERYNGFYSHRGSARLFRAWHDPWRSAQVEVAVDDEGLLQTLPGFAGARFAAAHYTPGLSGVLLGAPQRAESLRSHHGASAFYTMP